MSLGTSMLYLIPGVPIINGVMDTIDKHVLNGFARLLNAGLLIVSIALGLSFTLTILDVNPFVFTKLTRPDVVSAAIADGLFAAVAGTGFAIISKSAAKGIICNGLSFVYRPVFRVSATVFVISSCIIRSSCAIKWWRLRLPDWL